MLVIDCIQEFHASSDVTMDSARIENVDTLAALAVGIPVTEVVDVAKWFALFGFDEHAQLLQEVGAMWCLIASKYFEDSTGCIGKKEQTFVILGVGDSGHDH